MCCGGFCWRVSRVESAYIMRLDHYPVARASHVCRCHYSGWSRFPPSASRRLQLSTSSLSFLIYLCWLGDAAGRLFSLFVVRNNLKCPADARSGSSSRAACTYSPRIAPSRCCRLATSAPWTIYSCFFDWRAESSLVAVAQAPVECSPSALLACFVTEQTVFVMLWTI